MPVTTYAFGRMTVDGREYDQDLIIHRGRVIGSWWRREGHCLFSADLDALWAAPPAVLVVGTGYYGRMRVPEETRRTALAHGMEIQAAKTGDAVEIFNRLSGEAGADVAGAFHLTC